VPEEDGSSLSTVKINYANSFYLANSKTRGNVARVYPLHLLCLVSTWLAGFKITLHKNSVYPLHRDNRCFYGPKHIFVLHTLSKI